MDQGGTLLARRKGHDGDEVASDEDDSALYGSTARLAFADDFDDVV